jgi:hypothetical protein
MDYEETPEEWLYEGTNVELPKWSLFSEIQINQVNKRADQKQYKDRGGHFFEYLTKDSVSIQVIEYLRRFPDL